MPGHRPILLFLLIPFLTGLIMSQFFQWTFLTDTILYLSGLLVAFQLLLEHNKVKVSESKGVFLLNVGLHLFMLAFHMSSLGSSSDLSQEIVNGDAYIVKVDRARIGERSQVIEAMLLGAIRPDRLHLCRSGLVIIFKKEYFSETMERGSLMLVRGELKRIEKSKSDEVDWAGIYGKKGIYHRLFISKTADILVLRQGEGSGDLLAKTKAEIVHRFQSSNMSQTSKGLLIAMITGDKSYISKELRTSFSRAGIMHLLAVSGLHVGIVFILLNGIISFFIKHTNLPFSGNLMVIAGIWTYAGVTGFSSSVVRAALMVSLYLVSKELGRRADILNILALSAFISLLVDPQVLWKPGFQLSYLAVLGILFFYPLLSPLLHVRQKWLSYIWSLLSVSISAQLATFPLSVHYFGIFPNYFLLANLIAVPLSGFLVGGGFIMLIINGFPTLVQYTTPAMDTIMSGFAELIQIISELPFAYSDLKFNEYQVTMIYTLFVVLLNLLYRPYRLNLRLFQVVALLMIACWNLF